MKKNMLGKTGLEVSRLGIGLSEIGFNFTSNDFSTAEKVLNVALDEGINFLDTAACYGISEETIGLAVAHRRSDYVLANKAGHYLPKGEGEDWTYELITNTSATSFSKPHSNFPGSSKIKYLVMNSIPIVGCFFSNLKPILSLHCMSSILHLALIPSTITSYSLGAW